MKKVFLYFFIGIILIGIPITVFLVGKNQDVRKRAAPATTLSFDPISLTTKVGDEFDLNVKIDPASNQVISTQLDVVYDPAKLEAISFKNGPLTPSIILSQKIDPLGKALIKVGAQSNASPIVTPGIVAVLHMKALAASQTPVSVRFLADPDTYVNALGEEGKNVLVGTLPANITIHNADGTPATDVSPTLASNPTATPSSTPVLTPTLSPTQSATDSGEASPSAVSITSIKENEQINTDVPVIRGKGAPGSTITIIIHSTDSQTATVTVDENGNWVYTTNTPLAPGPHTVEAMSTDPATGVTQTTTIAFVVASGAGGEGVASGSAIPATGTVETTLLFISIGVLFIISGALLPLFIR